MSKTNKHLVGNPQISASLHNGPENFIVTVLGYVPVVDLSLSYIGSAPQMAPTKAGSNSPSESWCSACVVLPALTASPCHTPLLHLVSPSRTTLPTKPPPRSSRMLFSSMFSSFFYLILALPLYACTSIPLSNPHHQHPRGRLC